jgi:hypothetical protein
MELDQSKNNNRGNELAGCRATKTGALASAAHDASEKSTKREATELIASLWPAGESQSQAYESFTSNLHSAGAYERGKELAIVSF